MKFLTSILPSALLCALLLLCAPTPAHAYLDPGTGSMLVSALIGILATLLFFLKGVYYRGLDVFLALSNRQRRVRKASIVFYSEGKTYWNTFQPILAALTAKGEACTYLTSDEDDPGLAQNSPLVDARHIGKGNKAYTMLNMLEADICVLTTPGLDVLQIRRSPGVAHYAHVVHAVTDMAAYKLFSFDYYDSVLCSGAHQMRSLRALERARGTTPKLLLESGCPYLDVLATQAAALPPPEHAAGKPHILVAPTWGRNGLLSRFGMDLLGPLAREGYAITLRPHPQSRIAEAPLLESLRAELAAFPHVQWDHAPSGLASMARADVMISDFSGVVFDYAFLFARPVLTMAFEPDLRGTEAGDLPWPAWELDMLDVLGQRMALEDIPRLPQILEEVLQRPGHAEAVRTLRDDSVFHFGACGPVIAQQLLELRDQIRERKAT